MNKPVRSVSLQDILAQRKEQVKERPKTAQDTRFLVPLVNDNRDAILDLVAASKREEVAKLLLEGSPTFSFTTTAINGQGLHVYKSKDAQGNETEEIQMRFRNWYLYRRDPTAFGPNDIDKVVAHMTEGTPRSQVGIWPKQLWALMNQVYRQSIGIDEVESSEVDEAIPVAQGGVADPGDIPADPE